MTPGSLLGTALAVAFFAAVVIGMNAWILVPLLVLALAGLFAAPIAALLGSARFRAKPGADGRRRHRGRVTRWPVGGPRPGR